MGISMPAHTGAQNTQERLWLEIGAGHGEMTRVLAATGARVIAVELDSKLHARLQSLAQEFPRIEPAAGDILELDVSTLTGGARFSVYGNLPYYITSPILRRLFEYADALEDVYVVTQLEVAMRIAAPPGSRQFGYLSVLSQFYAEPEILLRIPRGAFRPPPKVTSALIHLRVPGQRKSIRDLDEAGFFGFVKLCFAQKRKTLVNNLRTVAAPKAVEGILRRLGLRGDARAEQIGVTQFAEIYRQWKVLAQPE
jgi:16S rRNA (adenine1518-N6/adenine1519-N6)-dimethyltransferase